MCRSLSIAMQIPFSLYCHKFSLFLWYELKIGAFFGIIGSREHSPTLLFNLPLFACFWRFYDLLSGTTVWGMGPLFQHQAVTDNAWAPGTEQGKLEGSAEGTVWQRWRCRPHFWGNGLRHFTSGTSIVLTSISMTKLPLPSISGWIKGDTCQPKVLVKR